MLVEVKGGLEGCPFGGVLTGVLSPLQLFALPFRCSEFLSVPAGHFGGFSLDVALDRVDAVRTIGDPGVEVFHSLVGSSSRVGGVEGVRLAGL